MSPVTNSQITSYINYKSFYYSQSDPEQQRDIAQTAWEGVIRQLKQNPVAPISHLKVRAKSSIINYRKSGCSVDGKLDQRGRQIRYTFVGLDKPLTPSSGRKVEDKALTSVLISDLYNQLSDTEAQVLNLRLEGVSWQNISKVLGGSVGDYRSPTRRKLEIITKKVLEV